MTGSALVFYDTSKELFFHNDYVYIRDRINTFKTNDIPAILENLYAAMENAFIYGAPLLENALYMDIAAVKVAYMTRLVSCTSSGTVAGFIGKTKYKYIDKAVNNTITWLNRVATEEELFELDTSPEGLKNLVNRCFQMNIEGV